MDDTVDTAYLRRAEHGLVIGVLDDLKTGDDQPGVAFTGPPSITKSWPLMKVREALTTTEPPSAISGGAFRIAKNTSSKFTTTAALPASMSTTTAIGLLPSRGKTGRC
ncbi:hypothetical protein [Streptosporangium oxazolinicum]|uniref:hypothetical protein n=1 Tax=Streptosporangium oxazolinicum TaxID=909287 RepID=UPI0031ECAABB